MTPRIAAAALAVAASLAACGEAVPDARPSEEATAETKIAKGTGTVTAVDAEAGTVTLDHQAIPELGWPAMVMTFKVDPALLAGAKEGDRVAFDLTVTGSSREVTALTRR